MFSYKIIQPVAYRCFFFIFLSIPLLHRVKRHCSNMSDIVKEIVFLIRNRYTKYGNHNNFCWVQIKFIHHKHGPHFRTELFSGHVACIQLLYMQFVTAQICCLTYGPTCIPDITGIKIISNNYSQVHAFKELIKSLLMCVWFIVTKIVNYSQI